MAGDDGQSGRQSGRQSGKSTKSTKRTKRTKRVENSTARLERARWRSRRGLLELELLLKPFVDGGFEQLSEDGQSDYERLLAHDDMDVHEWLLGRVAAPAPLRAIVTDIRAFLKLD